VTDEERICYDAPNQIDGDVLDVTRQAVQDVAAALRRVAEHFEAAGYQVRNARMGDALELPASELAVSYPEAVDEFGRVRVPDDDPVEGPLPHEDPYAFWLATDDAALVARIAGALQTAIRIVAQLEEAQPSGPEKG
jgi:hypothetical protein